MCRTQLEGDRRQNLLDELLTRERLLLASFKNEGAEPDLIRYDVFLPGDYVGGWKVSFAGITGVFPERLYSTSRLYPGPLQCLPWRDLSV